MTPFLVLDGPTAIEISCSASSSEDWVSIIRFPWCQSYDTSLARQLGHASRVRIVSERASTSAHDGFLSSKEYMIGLGDSLIESKGKPPSINLYGA